MRHPQPHGSFGDFYAEGCSVLLFDRDPGQVGIAWTNALRKNAREIPKNRGPRSLPLHFSEEENLERARRLLRATCTRHDLVRAPTTSICNNSSIASTLLRAARAFPDSLPLWATVDRSAPVWMIRQIPGSDHRLIKGVTWTWANDQVARCLFAARPVGRASPRASRGGWEARGSRCVPSDRITSQNGSLQARQRGPRHRWLQNRGTRRRR